jgi:hypothetical protein
MKGNDGWRCAGCTDDRVAKDDSLSMDAAETAGVPGSRRASLPTRQPEYICSGRVCPVIGDDGETAVGADRDGVDPKRASCATAEGPHGRDACGSKLHTRCDDLMVSLAVAYDDRKMAAFVEGELTECDRGWKAKVADDV